VYQNVYTPLQHLRPAPVNPGGLCWIVFARKADVAVWPLLDPNTNMAHTAFQLAAGKTWYELKPVNKDRVFQETQKDSTAGPFWDMSLSGYFGGTTVNHILASYIMPLEEFVIMFRDRAGVTRFMGTEDAGASCTQIYNSGDSDSGRKRTVTFSWQHANPATIYFGNLPALLTGIITPPFKQLGDFSDDFNDDFNN
jgi:hypothetical protein